MVILGCGCLSGSPLETELWLIRHLGLLPLLLRNFSECLLLFGSLFSPWQKETLGEISFNTPSSGVLRQVVTGTPAMDLTFSTMDRMWHAPRRIHLTWLCNHNWSSLRTPICSPNPGAPCEPLERHCLLRTQCSWLLRHSWTGLSWFIPSALSCHLSLSIDVFIPMLLVQAFTYCRSTERLNGPCHQYEDPMV